MQKPNNYEATKVAGDFTPVSLGGHHIVIKAVEETQSKGGKPMLKVSFDFAKNDSQPDYMMNEYKNDVRPDKKWPRVGTQYIMAEDAEGNCSRSFKSFITSFEKSNNCTAVWGEKFTTQFKNKKIGGVFGEVENEYNGNVSMRHELRWFCADDKAADAAIPAPKYLNGSSAAPKAKKEDIDVNVPEGEDEDVPF